MSAAIAEPFPQAITVLPGAATASTASMDAPQDAFAAMLTAAFDTKPAPPGADGGSPAASAPTIDGPAIPLLAKTSAAATIVATVPLTPNIPTATPPPPVAAPTLADPTPIPTAPEVTAASPPAKASPAKLAVATIKSNMPDPALAPETALPIPALPPALSSIILPPPDPPIVAFKPAAPAAGILSAPTAESAGPFPPFGSGVVTAEPLPADGPAKPQDRITDDPIVATTDPLPDTPAPQIPVAVPIHRAAAFEPTTVHLATALPGAPLAQGTTTQIGAAFVVLAREGDGTHHLTLLLQPPDLGELRITVEQGKDGPAKIAVTAANSSTLLTLLRDQPALNQALNSAGISGDGRVLTFHLAVVQDSAPMDATWAGQNSGDAAQSPKGDQSNGTPDQSPQTQPDTGGRSGRDQWQDPNDPPANAWFGEISPGERSATQARPTLTAIDITA